jgi:DNA-binding transcriptional MerR regulator
VIAKLLKPYRGRDDLSIDDLVHLAAEVVPQIVAGQSKHKVTEVPDARTIRYYIQEGLVDRPGGSAGPAAVYGYRHLLQIVAIKALQSEFVPIREIKRSIGSLSQEKLEARLEEWAARRPREASPSEALQQQVWSPAWPAMAREAERPPDGSPTGQRAAARQYLLGLRNRRAEEDSDQSLLQTSRSRSAPRSPGLPRSSHPEVVSAVASVDASATGARPIEPGPMEMAPTGWRRFELYPGIELHVKEGTGVPDSPSFFSVLASRLRVILEHLRQTISR